MSKTLVIAEKPSVATDLARVLGVKKAGDWYENDNYVISSAVGHLLEIKPAAGYEPEKGKWNFIPSLPPHFDLNPIDKNANKLAILRKLLKRKDVTAIINACDAGREGELIFRNIIRATGAKQPIRRLWLQSMTPASIRDAFNHLRSDSDLMPLADAAVSRSEADWLIGINATRALTKLNSQHGGFQKTTSGRVQTPTLAILTEREERIRSFEPKTYFEVFADFGVSAGNYRGRWFDPTFKRNGEDDARAERIWDRAKADAIAAKCAGKPGTIEEEKKPATQAPPQLYDLTTLQREANQRHGFPAKMTLSLAQALYERHKALTYPRTDSRYLPEDHIDPAKSVMAGIDNPQLAPHARKALDSDWIRPNKRIFNNAKVSDHFAIVPTGTAPKNLTEPEQKIFDMVSRRFVAVFFPAAQFEVTTRITTVEQEKFKTDGKVIVDPGWMIVYGRQADNGDENEKSVCPIRAGESARTESIEIKESQTKPPPRYTEATLLSAMEGAGKLVEDEELREAMRERGLGTPATRAQVIEGLLFEGYIARQGRDLHVTAKGISLITLLRASDAATLTKPELTGDWEAKLRAIEHGKLSRPEFMDEIRRLAKEIAEKVLGGLGKEVQGHYKPLEAKCPRCGNGTFRETFRAFECTNLECKLIVWKTMSDREFEREEVARLLSTGQVGPLEGFRSKFGKSFSAPIILNEKTEWKQKFDFGDDAENNGVVAQPVNPEPIGLCRACQTGQVYEYEKNYACEKAVEKKCKFRMGKLILEQPIDRENVRRLLETGKTSKLTKFISKKKRPFSAFLTLGKDGKVDFEFEPREKKKPAAPKEVKEEAKKPVEAKSA
jgi:DNA topoisomerase III